MLLLRTGTTGEDDARSIIRQVLSGLAYLASLKHKVIRLLVYAVLSY
jgi:hypothetical protein